MAHTQNTGIRQGCPLSPYLFIALMTVLFHDVHHIHKSTSQNSRVAGMEYDEVLYADDTICISESEAAMEKMLKAIVTEGAKYGMKLNKAKCELLAFGKARPVKFSDGTRLKPQEEVKYLGCSLNSKADSRRELQKRISECMMILKKLDIFWRHGDSSLKQKMEVYNAVVKTKLIYGLESMQLTQATAQKLDTFHLKGLRVMLKMETTFVNRENNNELVYARATQALRAESTPGAARSVEKLSVSYEKAKIRLFAKILTAQGGDPLSTVTFLRGLEPHAYGKKRVGRPRLNWITETTKLFWEKEIKSRYPYL